MTLRSVATFEPKRIFEGIRGSITFAAVATRPVRKSRDSPNASFLMRVLELGLNAFASQPDINVVFQRREWENIIKDIESAIKKINGPHAGTDWKDKQHFLAEAAKDFHYFKNAWRNYAMHFYEHYDASEAKLILDHVKTFMVHLAENGLKEPV